MEVEKKIRKIGNSMGVVIPSDFLKNMGIESGDPVYISLEDNVIKIRSTQSKKDNDEFKEKVITIIEEYMEQNNKS
ncbi:AbrB/MazE/SpoVT family DNA-binding domain-containing protein [Bacillus infantis]|uniref:AbrB/MazE/SpoVT family DNA-binding domain-containing protein n=1 Tax=Bacillus infantis TaxID=324767 RepID=UPI0013E9F789|nr:AbrB/MazE/SpoVT family DNA-binding domain-containing protein [Bacillus infantis]